MTHQNTLLTQTQMCPKGFDDEQSNIEKHFNVSFDEFFDSYTPCGNITGLKYHDKYLFATGHMDYMHVNDIIDDFEKKGLTPTVKIDGKEHWKDLCVVEVLQGLMTPCDWLEYSVEDNIVWLKGDSKGKIVIPDHLMKSRFDESYWNPEGEEGSGSDEGEDEEES